MPQAAGRAPAARSLTRDRVVAEAAAIVDEAGVDGLSMRTLADRLGVSAMTPYRFVGGKDELLATLADRFLGEVAEPSPDAAWDDRIRAVFRSVREVLLRHPALAVIVAGHGSSGVARYRGAEVVLTALDEAGLPDELAVSAFAALSAFTVGFVQREIADHDADLTERRENVRRLGSDFPHVTRSAETILSRDTEAHFETGLNLLLTGIRGATS
jgi:AcrR family transcriptional regulator